MHNASSDGFKPFCLRTQPTIVVEFVRPRSASDHCAVVVATDLCQHDDGSLTTACSGDDLSRRGRIAY